MGANRVARVKTADGDIQTDGSVLVGPPVHCDDRALCGDVVVCCLFRASPGVLYVRPVRLARVGGCFLSVSIPRASVLVLPAID